MKSIPIFAFFVLLMAQFAWSGQIKIWEDDKGVTHIEYNKSNTRKTSLSIPQKNEKPERQEAENIRKIQQRKTEIFRKQNENSRKNQQRKKEILRKQNELVRKIERQIPELQMKQKELSRKYENKLREIKGIRAGDDVITQMCKQKWGNNSKMVKYCIDTQKKLKGI